MRQNIRCKLENDSIVMVQEVPDLAGVYVYLPCFKAGSAITHSVAIPLLKNLKGSSVSSRYRRQLGAAPFLVNYYCRSFLNPIVNGHADFISQ
jgi:hypothetical protein